MKSRPNPLLPALIAAVLQALMVLAFAWPSANTAPRDLPLGVAGPQAAVTQVEQALAKAQPGAFELKSYPDEAAARAAIEDREVYGAIVLTQQGRKVLTASGAGPVVAQLLAQAAAAQDGAQGTAVEDVVAADPDDPRGSGFATMVLPLIMSGIAASALLTFLVRTARERLLGVFAFAVLGGLITTLVSHTWLSLTPGTYWEVAGVTLLASLSVAAPITGLASLIGPPGIGVGALVLLLLGNPFSGAASAPELLPQPWGDLGQLLQPGAAASLLRSVAFFDGAAMTGPLLVLLGWSLLGLVLLAVALRRRRPETATAPEPETVAHPT